MMFIESILRIPEEQKQFHSKTEPLALPIIAPSTSRSKGKKRRWDQNRLVRISSGCNCSPNISRTRSYLPNRWGLNKENEVFVIHERSCPLWYHSQITTKYSVNVSFLQRIIIFGSLNISRSPYSSIFGWNISQNLTFKAVVPYNTPAATVIHWHMMDPGPRSLEDRIKSCCQDLKVVFQSGQGSPSDVFDDGTTLIDVSNSFSWLQPLSLILLIYL